mgnify:CR=1 FL=1
MFNHLIKKIFIATLIFTTLISCGKNKKTIKKTIIKTINQLKIKSTIPDVKVFIALDPECPLSQSYTKKISQLHKKYHPKVLFVCFFPGDHYTDQEINLFVKKYNLNTEFFVDRKLIITKTFNASVVPEVFVLNNNYEIIYKGLIDNWIGEIGRKKQYINEEYLINAIEAALNNNLPLINSTEAIGCLIEI